MDPMPSGGPGGGHIATIGLRPIAPGAALRWSIQVGEGRTREHEIQGYCISRNRRPRPLPASRQVAPPPAAAIGGSGLRLIHDVKYRAGTHDVPIGTL